MSNQLLVGPSLVIEYLNCFLKIQGNEFIINERVFSGSLIQSVYLPNNSYIDGYAFTDVVI